MNWELVPKKRELISEGSASVSILGAYWFRYVISSYKLFMVIIKLHNHLAL